MLTTLGDFLQLTCDITVLTSMQAENVYLESGGDAKINTQIAAEKSASVKVKGNLEVQAAEGKREQEMEMTSNGPVISAGFNGVTVAFSHSESDSFGEVVRHIPSFIMAPHIVVAVDGNLIIKGAYFKGEKVEVEVGKQLLIESVKDISRSESDSSSVSLGVSFTGAGIAPYIGMSVENLSTVRCR